MRERYPKKIKKFLNSLILEEKSGEK